VLGPPAGVELAAAGPTSGWGQDLGVLKSAHPHQRSGPEHENVHENDGAPVEHHRTAEGMKGVRTRIVRVCVNGYKAFFKLPTSYLYTSKLLHLWLFLYTGPDLGQV